MKYNPNNLHWIVSKVIDLAKNKGFTASYVFNNNSLIGFGISQLALYYVYNF